jgi:hypothetical protein
MELGNTVKITADRESEKYKKQIEKGIIPLKSPMLTISPGVAGIDAVSSPTEQYYASRGLSTTVVGNKLIDIVHLHLKEWLDCIRNGGTTSANIEKAFEEGVTILMAHKSYLEKRRVTWDPVKEKII